MPLHFGISIQVNGIAVLDWILSRSTIVGQLYAVSSHPVFLIIFSMTAICLQDLASVEIGETPKPSIIIACNHQ